MAKMFNFIGRPGVGHENDQSDQWPQKIIAILLSLR